MAQTQARRKQSSNRRTPATSPGGEVFGRRSMTLPPELEAALAESIQPGNFSAFAQRALWHELHRERIAHWLDERDRARGGKPLPPEALEFAERAWRARKR